MTKHVPQQNALIAINTQRRTLRGMLGLPEARASIQDLSIFTRQFATLLDSGVPLAHSFDCFTDSTNGVHRCIEAVGKKVSSGYRLSQALRGFPRVFSPIYCGLVESGEATGQLVLVLLKMADDLEKQVKMQKKLVAALTYPAILMISATVCVGFFLTSVLPLLEPMFSSMRIPLPWPTQVLMHLRYIMPAVLVVTTILVVGGTMLYRYLGRDPVKLRQMHWLFFLKFPLFGKVYRTLTIARIIQSLATMLEVGLATVPAFKACESLSGNTYIVHQLLLVRKRLTDGETITWALQKQDLFPKTVVHLVAAGEETSELIGMFKYAARLLDEDTHLALDQMAMNLEPIIMVIMGVVVAFIVLAAMLPIVQLLQNL